MASSRGGGAYAAPSLAGLGDQRQRLRLRQEHGVVELQRKVRRGEGDRGGGRHVLRRRVGQGAARRERRRGREGQARGRLREGAAEAPVRRRRRGGERGGAGDHPRAEHGQREGRGEHLRLGGERRRRVRGVEPRRLGVGGVRVLRVGLPRALVVGRAGGRRLLSAGVRGAVLAGRPRLLEGAHLRGRGVIAFVVLGVPAVSRGVARALRLLLSAVLRARRRAGFRVRGPLLFIRRRVLAGLAAREVRARRLARLRVVVARLVGAPRHRAPARFRHRGPLEAQVIQARGVRAGALVVVRVVVGLREQRRRPVQRVGVRGRADLLEAVALGLLRAVALLGGRVGMREIPRVSVSLG